jgi:hypothetical protein
MNTCKGASAKRTSLKEQEEECENKSKCKYPRGSKPKRIKNKSIPSIWFWDLFCGFLEPSNPVIFKILD